MTMRPEVRDFLSMGPLPESTASTAEELDKLEGSLGQIAPPVSEEEARALLRSFGPDDCFGLAWTLVHLIETAPNPVLIEEPGESEGEWIRLLWERQSNG